MPDIYVNNKVFVGVKKAWICPKKAAKLNIDYVSSFKPYAVIGEHKWKNGDDVTGQFEIINDIVKPLTK